MSNTIPVDATLVIILVYLIIGLTCYKFLIPRLEDKSKKPYLLRYTWIGVTLLPLVGYVLKKIVERFT